MVEIEERIALLRDWKKKLEDAQEHTFEEYANFSKDEREKFRVKGCYAIYEEGNKSPVYIGSNTSKNRTVAGRIYNVNRGHSHPLPRRIIGYRFLQRPLFSKVDSNEKKENMERYKEYCKKNLSFRILEAETPIEKKNPLLMEIGLIFLFKPLYNHESKDFEFKS